MDRSALLASLASVSKDGVSLARAIYDAIFTTEGAPKQVSDIASGICDLSLILYDLRLALRYEEDLYGRKLLRRANSAVRRVRRTHETIRLLIEQVDGLGCLEESKAKDLLYQIEIQKNGVLLMVSIMNMAIHARDDSDDESDDDGEDCGSCIGASSVREQAENVVQASYYSLKTATIDWQGEAASDSGVEGDTEERVCGWQPQANDISKWLYDLVFAPADASRIDLEPSPESNSASETSSSLTLRERPALFQKPHQPSAVVDELLAEWTTLTEDEIEQGTRNDDERKESGKTRSRKEDKVPPIDFKDAVGRKFFFPYEMARTWEGMARLIRISFAHVAVIGPEVMRGRYDLLDADERILLPAVWEKLVEPGDQISMQMWPLPVLPRPKPVLMESRPFPGAPKNRPNAPEAQQPSVPEGHPKNPPGQPDIREEGQKNSPEGQPDVREDGQQNSPQGQPDIQEEGQQNNSEGKSDIREEGQASGPQGQSDVQEEGQQNDLGADREGSEWIQI